MALDNRSTQSSGIGLVARVLHGLLWLQLLFALGIGVYLYGVLSRLGVATWLAMVLAFFLGMVQVLALRMFITVYNFYLAAKLASPAPVALGVWQYARLFFAEFWASLYSSSWSMHHCTFATGRMGASQALPVLLIHGYICNSGYWHPFSQVLKRAKINHFALDLEPVFGSIEAYVPLVQRRVEAICAQTGSKKLILVGHSMGGLVARAYLRAYGPEQIAGIITLGTPHHGTGLANRGPGLNSRQMEWKPGGGAGVCSAWLTDLNANENQAARALISSIFSSHDNIVAPQVSSYLLGARNLQHHGIGHVALALNPLVQQQMLHEIERISGQNSEFGPVC
jgi:triacylglycerol lipase